MSRIALLIAVGVALVFAPLHAQDSTKKNQERRQIEVSLPIERRAAYDRVLAAFAAQEIPVANASAESGVLVGGPVAIGTYGAYTDNAFFRATVVAVDSTSRIYLSATFVEASLAAIATSLSGMQVAPQEKAVTSKGKGDQKKVWKRLEALAEQLRAGS